ncbi:MAG TPA: thiamine pyrophosphate-binding protein, partial [Umezawaea sp.]|nr:thiamine pyrophosphate-binding protein [Umezawaea sp.]
MTTTVRDRVHELLRAHGMTTVYGNPGSTELGFLSRWPDDFRYVLGLNEAAVVAMADGHSQVARTPVLVNLHSAAGLGNAMGSIVAAHANRAPLVILVGQQERALLAHDPFLGSADPTFFPLPYAKQSWQPARAADVPTVLARAIRTATQPPYGPVVMSVPNDDWNTGTEALNPTILRPPGGHAFGPDPSVLEDIATALQNSWRPAIVVGSAVDQDHAVTHAITLADACGATVFAAPMSSRCSFPEDHPRFAGHLPASPGPLAEALQWHDLVLVVGAPAFTYHVNSAPGPALPPLVVISDDDQVLARAPGVGLRSTMAAALQALADRVVPTNVAEPEPRVLPAMPKAPADGRPLPAAYVLAALRSVLPADALIVEEVPSQRAA